MSAEKNHQIPQLEHLYYIEAECSTPMLAGNIDEGSFIIVPITGGRFEGKRLKGTVLNLGSDWNVAKIGARLRSHIRTRYALQTDDGAIISLFTDGRTYGGMSTMMKMMVTRKADPEKLYFRQHLYFYTGDPGYTWLNHVVAFAVIGMGPVSGKEAMGPVCYDAYMLK